MEALSLIISLISGAIGGNVAGSANKDKNMGALANTLSGVLGGGLGDFLLKAAGVLAASGTAAVAGTPGAGELDIGALLANIGVSGVSGGVLTAVLSLIKNALEKK
jgi:uncharacterized membrane protein YeaQ/YmgE (transglycosylase-associated protein family)